MGQTGPSQLLRLPGLRPSSLPQFPYPWQGDGDAEEKISFFLSNKVKRINSGPKKSVIRRSMMSVPICVISIGNVYT